jgi:proteasome accessory factor C
MPAMPDMITERLDRILYILPLAARDGGVQLTELARALDCEPADVMRDLQEVTAREFYHPPGSTDQLQIYIEGDHVEVWTPAEFRQPVRLNAREALALGIGLRMLASEAHADKRDRILELAARLEQQLVPAEDDAAGRIPVREAAPAYQLSDVLFDAPAVESRATAQSAWSVSVEPGDDGFRSDLADAADRKRRCRILYLKPGAHEPVWRDIAPYMLVHASGTWYVLAHDASRDDVRVFRMDRMLLVEMTDESFDPPADLDARAFVGDGPGVYRPAADADIVTVRYRPRIARWIEERTACERAHDGSVIVRHHVTDPQWIIRHVLQYGAEAEVLEPATVRERVASAALRLSA